jgi:hypothetical protein
MLDLTGHWVAVVTEDWIYRMLTPAKGDPGSLPVNQEGRNAGAAWDAAKDKAAGESCRVNGAAGNIRQPGRLHITWQDDKTLKVEFSAGAQSRYLSFDRAAMRPGTPSLQGTSFASWERVRNYQQFGPPMIAPVGGTLKVVTSGMTPGYLQSNGYPYSANAKMTEYFDRVVYAGTPWLIVTTVVEDPQYLRDSLYWSTPFRQERDGSKWQPTPCGT